MGLIFCQYGFFINIILDLFGYKQLFGAILRMSYFRSVKYIDLDLVFLILIFFSVARLPKEVLSQQPQVGYLVT